MGDVYKMLGQAPINDGTANSVYTGPSGITAIVRGINIANTASANNTFQIHHCPSGISAGTANIVTPYRSMGPRESAVLDQGIYIIEPFQTFRVIASTPSTIVVTLYGLETS